MLNTNFILKSGCTQRKIAQDLNIKPQVLNNYIRGKAEPNIETLIKLADYFHTTIDALVEHEIPYLLDKSILNPECQKAIDRITKLTEHQCTLVNAYITGMLIAEEEKQNTISKFKGD